MSKFKNMYNMIKESISYKEHSNVTFNGTFDKCPLFIKNQIKFIFQQYVLSDRFINCRLNIKVDFDCEKLNIICENPMSNTSKKLYLNQISTTPAGIEAKQIFNRLAQHLIDWFNSQNIQINDFRKIDDIFNDFNLIIYSDAFYNI